MEFCAALRYLEQMLESVEPKGRKHRVVERVGGEEGRANEGEGERKQKPTKPSRVGSENKLCNNEKKWQMYFCSEGRGKQWGGLVCGR